MSETSWAACFALTDLKGYITYSISPQEKLNIQIPKYIREAVCKTHLSFSYRFGDWKQSLGQI